jgi:TRAP transporter TAXI family solute receptor
MPKFNVRRVLLVIAVTVTMGFGILVAGQHAAAQTAPPPVNTAPNFEAAPEGGYGIAAKRPVMAAACRTCPFGAFAVILKEAMKDSGYDIRICYQCAGPNGPLLVADHLPPPPISASLPPSLKKSAASLALSPALIPPAPNAPMDIGANNPQWLLWAYEGSHSNAGKPPRHNLRVIASLQDPKYLIVAVKKGSGITNLTQLKGKPVKILIDYTPMPLDVLAYFGMSKESIEAAGGNVLQGVVPSLRKNFDAIIFTGALTNTPEFGIWYEVSQKFDLEYLALPDELLQKLAADYHYERRSIPIGLLRGVDQPIATIGASTLVLFGRDDTPDELAYALAKELDQHQELLMWNIDNTSYNVHTVWKTNGVPLHPGAERYYREKGYMQ